MACVANIPFSTDVNILLTRAKKEALLHKAFFDGNNNSGKFALKALGGTFMGTYVVVGQVLQINITSKPFFVPCTVIISFLENQLH